MLNKIFAWWNGATLGALFDVHRRAAIVGSDEFGNRYFEEKKISPGGRKRRYVLFKGLAEPSKVPPDWHGWLHYTFEEPPTTRPFKVKAWELAHRPNLTGTRFAYRPPGALSEGGKRAKASGDYQAWTPEG